MQTQPQRRTYQQGAIIVRDGDCGDNFFLIGKGSVEVYNVGADGKKLTEAQIQIIAPDPVAEKKKKTPT
jgi:CRP-like cAMP-binding protein